MTILNENRNLKAAHHLMISLTCIQTIHRIRYTQSQIWWAPGLGRLAPACALFILQMDGLWLLIVVLFMALHSYIYCTYESKRAYGCGRCAR